ncbi:MFS transporter [Diplocarpon rosae]|nr:MFS transporter [Diplocarpon rosae]
MDPALRELQGLRIAVEGCGHGTLDAIYASVAKACEVRCWNGVDLLIIGGDFQSVRNASDLTVMSCPVKYREIGDFHAYYSGAAKAPYLTIFVGGNHEASSHLWELFYGGWVAPNIYYMGAANVVRLGGVRIAGMSGIWKGYNFKKTHYERLPYSEDDVKSIYHVREVDVRKLLQLRTQIDIGISHDWPRAIENHGNAKSLWAMKPDFERESKEGTLGSLAAAYVMDRLRPPYWFSAHMHCKFAATKIYNDARKSDGAPAPALALISNSQTTVQPVTLAATHNSDEIDLDDEEEPTLAQPVASNMTAVANKDEIAVDEDGDEDEPTDQVNCVIAASNEAEISLGDNETSNSAPISSVSSDLRAQLPAAFSRPPIPFMRQGVVEQTIPADIKNKTVRFLALDKCLPKRKFLQLLEVRPYEDAGKPSTMDGLRPKPKFEYDPEWLAITRAFASHMIFGDKSARTPEDLGEATYRPLIEKERVWVEENVVGKGKLGIPENFTLTAPPFVVGMPEIVEDGPLEYNNPQMQEFCDLIGIENRFFSSEEERQERMRNGPRPRELRHGGGIGGRGRGGRGGRSGGRGSGRGDGRGRGPGPGRF